MLRRTVGGGWLMTKRNCTTKPLPITPKPSDLTRRRPVTFLAGATPIEAIRINRNYVPSYINRGRAYGSKREFDRAIGDLSEAIRLDSKNTVAFNNRGLVYEDTRDYDKAISDYAEAIRLDSKDPDGYNNLARLLATCPKDSVRNGKHAVELATKANALSLGKVSDIASTLASAYAECGDFNEAIKWQQKAIALGDLRGDRLRIAQDRLKLYEDRKPFRK